MCTIDLLKLIWNIYFMKEKKIVVCHKNVFKVFLSILMTAILFPLFFVSLFLFSLLNYFLFFSLFNSFIFLIHFPSPLFFNLPLFLSLWHFLSSLSSLHSFSPCFLLSLVFLNTFHSIIFILPTRPSSGC